MLTLFFWHDPSTFEHFFACGKIGCPRFVLYFPCPLKLSISLRRQGSMQWVMVLTHHQKWVLECTNCDWHIMSSGSFFTWTRKYIFFLVVSSFWQCWYIKFKYNTVCVNFLQFYVCLIFLLPGKPWCLIIIICVLLCFLLYNAYHSFKIMMSTYNINLPPEWKWVFKKYFCP